MNLKDYISSGIVESYVLGLANKEERIEFEAMCREHPEVEFSRTAFEASLQKHAFDNAMQAPPYLKQKIFSGSDLEDKLPIATGNTQNIPDDSDYIIIRMALNNIPAGPAQGNLSTIYWHRQSKDIYLLVNGLPSPPADKQYQLWAIANGKPLDAGLINNSNNNKLVKMKSIAVAEAFAITLEKQGGSSAPTMEQLYMLCKV